MATSPTVNGQFDWVKFKFVYMPTMELKLADL